MYPEDDYLTLLGRALYSMNYCEYLAIEVTCWLDKNLDFARLAGSEGGAIADALKAAVALAGPSVPVEAVEIANQFGLLVYDRNDVIHARPSTDNQGRQRLFRWAPTRPRARTQTVTEDVLKALADKSLAINERLGALREHLKATRPADSPLGY